MNPAFPTTDKLVLASSSPYRKALLGKLGLPFETASPAIDETPSSGEQPQELALRLAREKAAALATAFPEHLIIGSDQVAVLGEQRLSKPGDRANALRQLRAAAGKSVAFYTSVCVLNAASGESRSDLDRTLVWFRPLTEAQIERYVDKEKPFDCAGSFKSESLGIALFEKLETEDPNALIGLPLIRLIGLLEAFGLTIP